MIASDDRTLVIGLVDEAVSSGARHKACAVLELDVRTVQRWRKALQTRQTVADQRKAAAANRAPANKLSDLERARILAVSSTPEFCSLPPSQIVPRFADRGEFIASESSFYRVLRTADQVNRRGSR